MSIMEWIWLFVAAFGAGLYLRGRFGNIGDFHGSGMARYAATRLGLYIASAGIVLFLIALAI